MQWLKKQYLWECAMESKKDQTFLKGSNYNAFAIIHLDKLKTFTLNFICPFIGNDQSNVLRVTQKMYQ